MWKMPETEKKIVKHNKLSSFNHKWTIRVKVGRDGYFDTLLKGV